MMQWICVCRYFTEILFSILYILKCNYWILWQLFVIFWETSILFSIASAPFYTSTSSSQGFQFPYIFTKMFYFLCFGSGHPTGVRWHLVVLICISLMTSEFDYFFFICFLSPCIFFWRNICSRHSYFLIWLFSCCWVLDVLYIFWILALYTFYGL